MPFDAHKNLAVATVELAPSPGDTGTYLIVTAGQGARFPAPPFNVTLWPQAAMPTPLTAEVARVVAASGDQFTLERAQEGTTAQLVTVGYLMAETITAKALQDIESGTNFPLITTPGDITSGNVNTGNVNASGVVTATSVAASGITAGLATITEVQAAEVHASASVSSPLGQFDYVGVENTLDAASITTETVDASSQITAPVAHFGTLGSTPLDPAFIIAPIPDAKLSVNVLKHTGGYPGGVTTFLRADGTFANAASGAPAAHHTTHEVGGTDPIANVAWTNQANTFTQVQSFNGHLVTATSNGVIRAATVDGTDTSSVTLAGGGAIGATRGGTVTAYGNEASGTGNIEVVAGASAGKVRFATGPSSSAAMTIFPSGGVDIGSGVDPGTANLSVAGDVILPSGGRAIRAGTADGADTASITLSGGGGTTSDRGAKVAVYGDEHATSGGLLQLYSGNSGARQQIEFAVGGVVRGTMHTSGGLAWGGGTDPGAGNLSVGGITASQMVRSNGAVAPLSSAGLAAEMAFASGAGYFQVYDRTNSVYGPAILAGSTVQLMTSATVRGTVHPSGGFSWGGISDPGAGTLMVGPGPYIAGSNFIVLRPDGAMDTGRSGSATQIHVTFFNANGGVGNINTSGSTTAYATTSDARLKTDRGLVTDTDVLRSTRIHHFTWNTDGTVGRGVFAQEAITVAPFAVTVGTDHRDDNGQLSRPWGVDYSKYVPDLIVGWQAHDAKVAALEAKVARLEALIEKLLT